MPNSDKREWKAAAEEHDEHGGQLVAVVDAEWQSL